MAVFFTYFVICDQIKGHILGVEDGGPGRVNWGEPGGPPPALVITGGNPGSMLCRGWSTPIPRSPGLSPNIGEGPLWTIKFFFKFKFSLFKIVL